MEKRLGGDAIKYIAIFAMLLDHIGWTFLPFASPLSQIFHTVGRITAPIMCFFIAEGYRRTKDVKKYLMRLFIFALVSQIPWCVMHGQSLDTLSFNMFFTLFFALLAVIAEDKIENPTLRTLAVFSCAAATVFSDWYVFAVLWSVSFFRFKAEPKKLFLSFSAVSLMYSGYMFYLNLEAGNDPEKSLLSVLFTLGTFLSLPFISSYDETKRPNKKSRLVFYLFYPLHMLLLGIVKYLIQ